MDNYINLAELRKTAEAILVKMQDKLDEKANIDDFILEEGYDDDYNYKIKLTNDKSFIVPWNWVRNIASDAAQSQIDDALSGITAISDISITNTLSSGNLIATINGTNIYAPSYTDADGVSY